MGFSLWRYFFERKIKLSIEEYLWPLIMFFPGYIGIRLRYIVLRMICAKVGKSVKVYKGVRISQAYNISLGNEVNINTGVYLDGHDKMEIGDYCLIGPDVKIITSNHIIDNISKPSTKYPCINSPVIIEEDVWIGAGVVILPGVTLRKGTVIGAGAVVNKDTESYCLYAGIPAKLIRKREMKG